MNPRPSRTVLGAIALTAVSLGSLAACSTSDDAATTGTDLRTFTVVLDWSPNTNHAGMYLARDKGWYEDAGLDVEFVEPGDSGSLTLLAAGKADVAVSVQEEVIPARAEGLPVHSIAAILQHNTSSLISLADDGIERPKDLEGKTYGGFGGPLETALVNTLVQCDGGDPGKVDFVDVGEADYRAGMEADQYDVAWVFDGWDGIALDQAGADVNSLSFIDHTDCIPDWYTPLLATSDDVETDRSADLEAFLAATAKGYQEAASDPKAAADALLATTDDLDPDLVAASAEYLSTRYADDPAAWGRQDAAVWNEFAAFLLDAGLIDEAIDTDAAWTNEYLPSS